MKIKQAWPKDYLFSHTSLLHAATITFKEKDFQIFRDFLHRFKQTDCNLIPHINNDPSYDNITHPRWSILIFNQMKIHTKSVIWPSCHLIPLFLSWSRFLWGKKKFKLQICHFNNWEVHQLICISSTERCHLRWHHAILHLHLILWLCLFPCNNKN